MIHLGAYGITSCKPLAHMLKGDAMKKVWILALSLLMVLTLLVACKETKDPVETSGETATGAAAVTEPETEPKTDPETEM